MCRCRGRGTGFSLLELAVATGITAVLACITLKVVSTFRSMARDTTCQSGMWNMGKAFMSFTTTHEGRFPNYAPSTVEYWGPIWGQILNREYYHSNDPSIYPTSAYGDDPTCGPLLRWWNFWDTGTPKYYDNSLLSKKWLPCPAYKAWGSYPSGPSNIWTRNRVISNHAAGGNYDWAISDFGGKMVSNPQAYHANYAAYYLGARVDAFASPSLKYLSWDAESGSDYGRSQGTNTITLRSDVNRPPWSGPGGTWAFRHNLPSDVGLYQKQARGMALYVDGHAQKMNPNDAVYQNSHFVANP